MIPEGSKVTMTAGPDTYEYTAGKPLPANKAPRVRVSMPHQGYAKGGTPIMPPGMKRIGECPSVGRIVHYYGEGNVGELTPFAAIITAVYAYGTSLDIRYPVGRYEDPTPSDGVWPFSETPKPGHWSWPPRG